MLAARRVLLDVTREIIRLRAAAREPAAYRRLVWPLRGAASNFSAESLVVAVERFATHPASETAEWVAVESIRVLFLPSGSLRCPVCLTSNPELANKVRRVGQQMWAPIEVSPLEAAASVLEAGAPPAAILIDVARGTDDALELVGRIAGDLMLRDIGLVALGPSAGDLRAQALGVGAWLYFDSEQADSTLFRETLGALLGFVDGTGVQELEDPSLGLPPLGVLRREVRQAIERYALYEIQRWVLVGVHCTNAEGRRPLDQDTLVRRGLARVRSVAPEGAFFGRLGGTSFAVLMLDPTSEQVAALSSPGPSLEEALLPAGEAPALRVCAVQGGVCSATEALDALRRELTSATGSVVEDVVAVGSERRSSVLVIDDDPSMAKFISIVVRGMGLAPIWRADGAAGAAELAANADLFSAVILDLHLPTLDGFQVLARLRGTHGNELPPVLVLTGSDDDNYQVAALERGAGDYLQKPIAPRVLAARLRRLMRLPIPDEAP